MVRFARHRGPWVYDKVKGAVWLQPGLPLESLANVVLAFLVFFNNDFYWCIFSLLELMIA